MSKVFQVGQKIDGLKIGVKNDVTVQLLALPVPTLKVGDKGDRVKGLQTALARLGFLPESHVNGTYEVQTARALARVQKDWGIKGLDHYDATTRAALQKALAGEHPPGEPHKLPTKPVPPHHPAPQHAANASLREKIIANAQWGVHNEPRILYAEIRPIQGLHHPHQLPLTIDCSGFTTLCYKWAGAPDPNGNGYDGQGFTGTQLNHMKHISREHVQPGDLVVFGSGSGHHVAIALDAGGHRLASHGGKSGPLLISFDAEHKYQRDNGHGETTWLSILHDEAAQQPGGHSSATHPAGGHPPPAHPPGGHPQPAHPAGGHPAPAKPHPPAHNKKK